MGYRAWDIWSDYDYVRELREWQRWEDALDREQLEQDRLERERNGGDDVRFPLQPRVGT